MKRVITVKIKKHVLPGRWIAFSDNIGWTGPSFRTKKAVREWALKIGYQVSEE
jgi:hypothetical protein